MDLDQLLALCQCPCCQAGLKIVEGHVQCTQGHRFPLFNERVPILMPPAELSNPDSQQFTHTSQSFSRQWGLYQKGDKIWGMSPDELKALFLKESGFTEDELKGKRVLDLGCGHGEHSRLMAELGAEVIGFDVSQGFFQTEKELPDELRSRLHFVQGDIFHFPIKQEAFDFVWSEGVLHHTPNTQKAFENVHASVKPGGKLYVSLYRQGAPYFPIQNTLRKISTKLPGGLLVAFCWLGAPFFAVLKWFLNLTGLGARKFEPRTLRENAVSLHDTYSPPYAWHHSPEEVQEWFNQAGFERLETSSVSPHLFGVKGFRKN